MEPGTYTLLVELSAPRTVTFGAAGERDLDEGWYAYTGTAFGPGGLARADRHARVAAGEHDARHWHVDHLLGAPETSLVAAWETPDADRECAVTDAVPAERVPGVGATDCDCPAHLAYAPERAPVERALREAHDRRHDEAEWPSR
jgi:Uri superfamily endonuclease